MDIDTDDRIRNFFTSFLETVAREIENDNRNSDLTCRKIRCFSDFIHNNGRQIINNNEFLSNYYDTFNLNRHNHCIIGKPEYYFLTDEEKKQARTYGSRQNYSKIPMDNHIHDVINCIEKQDIPRLVHFFSQHTELFEELYRNFVSIV
jgi:hypothetical protein